MIYFIFEFVPEFIHFFENIFPDFKS
jgi:hypothetical protein